MSLATHNASLEGTTTGYGIIKQEPTEDIAVPQFAMQSAFDRKRKHDSISYQTPLSPMSPCTTDDAAMFHVEKRLKMRRDSAASDILLPVESLDLPVIDDHIAEDALGMTEVTDVIRAQFGFEILRKHNELRLIQSELAKCQTALEQLRRCHLMPYPVNVPTPTQMVEIAQGKGPAIKWPGESVVKWAPPFGVVDGPYARHLAKWLIPDPVFDGGIPEAMLPVDARGVRVPQTEYIGKRSTRSGSTAKFGSFAVAAESAPSHVIVPPPATPAKEKQGLPSCVVKRSDGVLVRLECLHCHRGHFSSTQGFINHCRIAHKVDYKSHDEAGYKCGIPIDKTELATIKAPPPPPPPPSTPTTPAVTAPPAVPILDGPTAVHQLNRADILESDVCSLLLSRIQDTRKLMSASKDTLAKFGRDCQSIARFSGPRVSPNSCATSASGDSPTVDNDNFVGCSETPALSKYLASKNVSVNLTEIMSELTDESSDEESDGYESDGDVDMPDSSFVAPASSSTVPRPTLVIKRHGTVLSRCASEEAKTSTNVPDMNEAQTEDMSPKTVVSQCAPSLVYDSGSEEDDVASVASGGSPNVDVADASCDEDSGRERYGNSIKRGDSPLDDDYEVEKQQKGKSSGKTVARSSKFAPGARRG